MSQDTENLQYAKENKNNYSYNAFLRMKFQDQGLRNLLKDFASRGQIIFYNHYINLHFHQQ